MTVAVALVCKDGVLVASDSMESTGLLAATRTKVRRLDRAPVIWTAAGSIYTTEEVTEALKTMDEGGAAGQPMKCFTIPDLSSLRKQLANNVRPAMQKSYAGIISGTPFPQGHTSDNALAEFLLTGYANGTPWLLQISVDGSVVWHTDRKFATIGSGSMFATVAMAFMLHYVSDDMTLRHGQMLAYRTIESTIAVSSQSVGPPVQLAICDADGPRILTDPELEQIKYGVESWKALERDSLEGSLGEAEHDLPTMPDGIG